MDIPNREGETLDSMCGVRIVQRARGYRFNLDAVLLARFGVEDLEAERPLRVIDLGTGSGIVACLLATWRPEWSVTAVEVQPSLADLARRNVALHGLAVDVIESDWRKLGQRGKAGDAHLVVCNPPYHVTGKTPVDPERAAARKETHGDLGDAIASAARLVRGNGSVRFVCAIGRLAEFMAACSNASLGVVRMRFIHPRADEPAYAFLIDARPASKRPTVVSPSLIVHGSDGDYSAEVQAMLR